MHTRSPAFIRPMSPKLLSLASPRRLRSCAAAHPKGNESVPRFIKVLTTKDTVCPQDRSCPDDSYVGEGWGEGGGGGGEVKGSRWPRGANEAPEENRRTSYLASP